MTTYLITGASRGLGLEFARQLAAKGNDVLATARDPKRAEALAALGPKVRVLTLDVSAPASIAALGGQLEGLGVDVLINNAGVSSTSKSIEHLEAEELQRVLFINGIAPMLVTRAVLPALRRGMGKTIVHITSQLGSIANNTGGSTYGYRASKAALNQFNRSLANELSPQGFTSVAIHPGWVRTDMGGPSAHLSPQESVSSMLATIAKLKSTDTGAFLNYDGTGLPW